MSSVRSILDRYRQLMAEWRREYFDDSQLDEPSYIIVAAVDWTSYVKIDTNGTHSGREIAMVVANSACFKGIPASKMRILHGSKDIRVEV